MIVAFWATLGKRNGRCRRRGMKMVEGKKLATRVNYYDYVGG